MSDEKFLQIKTAVNTRMPIELRTTAVQQPLQTVPGSDGTILFPRRHPVKSTYNDTYRHYYITPGTMATHGGGGAAGGKNNISTGGNVGGGASSPMKPSGNNNFGASGSPVQPTSFGAAAAAAAPQQSQDSFTLSQQRAVMGGPMQVMGFDDVAKSQFSSNVNAADEGFYVEPEEAGPGKKKSEAPQQPGGATTNNFNGSGSAPRRQGPVMVSTQRAEYTGAGAVNGPDALDQHLSFYSKVRKQEAADDHDRKGLSDLQRTVETSKKRQTDDAFRPPVFDMETCARNMRLARTAGSAASTSSTADGGSPTKSVSSPTASGKTVRSQSVDATGRALPLCLTANGQVRHGTRTMPIDVTTNICCTIPTKPTTQQKEFELPPPHIPVEISPEYIAQRRAITEGASGLDLFQGTAKASPSVIPLFMGHVPGSERNIVKRQAPDTDVLRQHSKRFINIAIPAHLEAGGNGGRTVSDRSSNSISQTVMGFYSEQAAHAAKEERQLNTRAPKPF